MRFRQTQTVAARLESSAEARRDRLARFQARPSGDHPLVLARQAARKAVADARAALREAEAEQAAVQRAAELKARTLAQDAERARERQAPPKLQRDARYLARKAKVQKRG